jgi:hypothetical protein
MFSLKGVEKGSNPKFNVGFLLAPHSDQSAISNRFRRTQQRYRRTDRQTDRIGIAIVDLMLRATRWHRSQKPMDPSKRTRERLTSIDHLPNETTLTPINDNNCIRV